MLKQAPLKLKPAFHEATGLKLGRKIYSGNGEIYTIQGHDDKVVKIVFTYDDPPSENLKLLKYLKRSKNPAVVKLYHTGTMKVLEPGSGYNSDVKNMDYHVHCYYYVMEKLSLMPRQMRDHDFYILADGVETGKVSSKARKSVKTFVKHAAKIKYYYGDLHAYNIMRAKNGSLKFVDLESFCY